VYSVSTGKCNVLILTGSYGEGHNQVSNAVKDKILREQPDWTVQICDFFDYVDPVFNHLIHFGYHQVIKHFSYGYKWFYEATQELDPNSRFQRILNRMGQQKLLETIELFSPDAIVCTFPTPAGVVSQLKAKGKIDIPLITIITDVAVHSQWIHPYVDFYLVAANTVARQLHHRGIPQEKILVTGIPLRRQFEEPLVGSDFLDKNRLDPGLFTLMIMGGGIGFFQGIEEIILQLDRLVYPIQLLVITGTNKVLARKLLHISESCRNRICVFGHVDNIAEIMEHSDLLLTKAGGVTIFEALAKKLPMILFHPLPGHEMSNVRYLTSNKAAILAENEEAVIQNISMLRKEPQLLERMKKVMEQMSRPTAAGDAARVIIEAARAYRSQNPGRSKAESGYRELLAENS